MAVVAVLVGFGVLLALAITRLGRVPDIDVSDVPAGPVVLVAGAAALAAFGVGGTTVLRSTDASAVTAACTGIVLAGGAAAIAVRAVRSRL